MCLKYRQFTENIDNRIIQNKLKNHLKGRSSLLSNCCEWCQKRIRI